MKSKNYILCLLSLLVMTAVSCKKGFLDAKPSSTILQPQTLDDFQSLLENNNITYSPALPTLAGDEYVYISYPIWQSARTATERNSYVWAVNLFNGETSGGDWSIPYQAIFYSNNVLAGLDKFQSEGNDLSRIKFIKGWALFARAFAYFELVNNFSTAYDPSTANADLGVPIKLNPSVDDIQPRSSVQHTYDQILSDLNAATPLLSATLPLNNREQPSQIAVHALLARVYLNMRKYDLAESQADSTLHLYNTLIDYNAVSTTSIQPFLKTNDELIFYKSANTSYASATVFHNSYTRVNPALINLYDHNDLRLQIFYSLQPDSSNIMKVQYDGLTTLYPFTGLATDEVYLIKAECAARRNDVGTAMTYLNDLLINRYSTNTFTSVTASTSTDALNKILIERRKELVWRNLRWYDIKRLNKGGENITLTRLLNGQVYTLPPNDPRDVFPIPDNEISSSGIQQNVR